MSFGVERNPATPGTTPQEKRVLRGPGFGHQLDSKGFTANIRQAALVYWDFAFWREHGY